MKEVNNWKLKEVIDKIELIDQDSIKFRDKILKQKGFPLCNNLSGLDRKETIINWDKMNSYYSFYSDNESEQEQIGIALSNSEIGREENLIILYGWEEPVVKLPSKLFINDWEGFIRSTLWETFIFSEDYKLIIEVTRDYYFHSNFNIYP